jgi:hypothetical protein
MRVAHRYSERTMPEDSEVFQERLTGFGIVFTVQC